MGKSFIEECEFIKKFKNWKTPNSYDKDYGEIPYSSGVYIITTPIYEFTYDGNVIRIGQDILYIGQTQSLKKRYTGHNYLSILRIVYGYVQFYYKERKTDLGMVEKQMIEEYKPKFNVQYKPI